MFYTKREKLFLKTNEIGFTEKAHEYPCCEVPTLRMCLQCDPDKAGIEFCENKADLVEAFIE